MVGIPQESTICTRILKYASTLQPVNRAYIVSLLGSGTGRTRRIARWVAHGIITDKNVVRNVCAMSPLYGEDTNLSLEAVL